MTSLSERLRGPEPVVAPSVFDALTARLARGLPPISGPALKLEFGAG